MENRKKYLLGTTILSLSAHLLVAEFFNEATDTCPPHSHSVVSIYCRTPSLPPVDGPHRDHEPGPLTRLNLTAVSTATATFSPGNWTTTSTSSSTTLTPANETVKFTQ
jgi:hypothetical protein